MDFKRRKLNEKLQNDVGSNLEINPAYNNYESIDHGTTINHGTINHGTINHGTINHGTINHGTINHGTIKHGNELINIYNISLDNLMCRAIQKDHEIEATTTKGSLRKQLTQCFREFVSNISPISCIIGYIIMNIIFNKLVLFDVDVSHCDLAQAYCENKGDKVKQCISLLFENIRNERVLKEMFQWWKIINKRTKIIDNQHEGRFQALRDYCSNQDIPMVITDIILDYDSVLPCFVFSEINEWDLCNLVEASWYLNLTGHPSIVNVVENKLNVASLQCFEDISSIFMVTSLNAKQNKLCYDLLDGLIHYRNYIQRFRQNGSVRNLCQILEIQHDLKSIKRASMTSSQCVETYQLYDDSD